MIQNPFIFFGVDQTGAVDAKTKRPKPLAAARLRVNYPRANHIDLRLEAGLRLPSLSRDLCLEWMGSDAARSVWLVDCVLGLPRSIPVESIWELMRSTHQSSSLPAYGRAAAEYFFSQILIHRGLSLEPPFPSRLCESLAEANSVFRVRPYQKNIQTGTFRLWKDLTSHAVQGDTPLQWIHLWPFDHGQRSIAQSACQRGWMMEGYPSLLWKNELGLSTRDRGVVRQKITDRLQEVSFGNQISLVCSDWHFIEENADFADAAILAVGGFLLHQQGKLWRRGDAQVPLQEGWIAGL